MSDCGSEDHTTGQLDYDTVYEDYSYWPPSSCQDFAQQLTSDYEIALGTSAHHEDTEKYYEIATEKDWYLKSFFKNRPENLLDEENCNPEDQCNSEDCTKPSPINVEYEVARPGNGDNAIEDYEFKDPTPDGSSNDTYDFDVLGTVVGLIGTATGNPYASAVGGFLTSDLVAISSSDVEFSQSGLENQDKWHWKINMSRSSEEGYESFPTEACDSTGIRVSVYNKDGPGAEHSVDTYSRYTYAYPGYGDGCPCTWYGADLYYKTTFYAYNSCDWESI